MVAMENGRVCTLARGRRAGEKVVIIKIEDGRAVVKDKKGKERTVSVKHLEPTEKKA